MGINAFLKPEDLMDRAQLVPGWAPLEIFNYTEEITKDKPNKPSDGSTNAVFHFRVLDGPNKGMELKRYFNEKYLSMGKGLWAVLFGLDEKKGGNISSEMFASSVGKQLGGYLQKDKEGKYTEISEYKPKYW